AMAGSGFESNGSRGGWRRADDQVTVCGQTGLWAAAPRQRIGTHAARCRCGASSTFGSADFEPSATFEGSIDSRVTAIDRTTVGRRGGDHHAGRASGSRDGQGAEKERKAMSG